MNAVASRASADHHGQVARQAVLERLVARHDADDAAIDERVAQVAVVEVERPVGRGNAHAVAVVANAADHAAHDALGVQYALRQLRHVGVRRREAEDIGVHHRPGAQARTHGIADAAADARGGATVGLDGRRVVVRLDLEADVVLVVEADDPGIVLEDRDAPGLVEFVRHPGDGGLQQIVDGLFAVVLDDSPEGLVHAVLGPRLGQGLEFDVRRLAAQRLVVLLNGLHLRQRQEQVRLARQGLEVVVGQRPERHLGLLELVGLAFAEHVGPVAGGHVLDALVGQHAGGQGAEGDRVGRALDVVAHAGVGRFERNAHVARCHQQRRLDGVHHAGFSRHEHGLPAGDVIGAVARPVTETGAEAIEFRDRVGQQLPGDRVDLTGGGIGLEEVDAAGGHVLDTPDVQVLRPGQGRPADGVLQRRAWKHFNLKRQR